LDAIRESNLAEGASQAAGSTLQGDTAASSGIDSDFATMRIQIGEVTLIHYEGPSDYLIQLPALLKKIGEIHPGPDEPVPVPE
jgi:hypothetical protein